MKEHEKGQGVQGPEIDSVSNGKTGTTREIMYPTEEEIYGAKSLSREKQR